MKKNIVAITALFIGATSLVSASSVYSPDRGVICDKKSGFCVDSYGISLGMTKEYLGSRAERKWTKILNGGIDTKHFTFSNGLSCDTQQKICKKSKWDDNADSHWTRVLFGSSAVHSSGGSNHKARLAASDCKNYISEKFGLRKSTIHTSNINVRPANIRVHISINSSHPLVEESGTCRVIDGDVSYRASYEN